MKVHVTRSLFALVAVVALTVGGTAHAAVQFPQLDIHNLSSDAGYADDGTSVSIEATAFELLTAPGAPAGLDDELFSLAATIATGSGTFTIGVLLSASFENFLIVELEPGIGTFSADLTYTGGSLKGNLPGGRLEGAFSFNDGTGITDVTAKVGPVSPVPVPAAFWLFGSGLVWLARTGRFRK